MASMSWPMPHSVHKWRLIGGVRLEDAKADVETIDPLVPGAVPAIASLQNRDPFRQSTLSMPSHRNRTCGLATAARCPGRISASYRLSSSPMFSEASTRSAIPTSSGPLSKLRRPVGVVSGGDQVIAASYFRKEFTDPIEVTVQPTTDLRQSFINANKATNQGIELEWRENLRFIHEKLLPFSLQTNLTLVDSNVDLPGTRRFC